jgi:hypothetical protein
MSAQSEAPKEPIRIAVSLSLKTAGLFEKAFTEKRTCENLGVGSCGRHCDLYKQALNLSQTIILDLLAYAEYRASVRCHPCAAEIPPCHLAGVTLRVLSSGLRARRRWPFC